MQYKTGQAKERRVAYAYALIAIVVGKEAHFKLNSYL